MKKYIRRILFIMLEFTIITLFLSLLSYFNLINENIYNYLEFAVIFIILYFNGKNVSRGGKLDFIEGLKIGLIFMAIFIIFNVIFRNPFNIRQFIYYLLILLTPLLGSIRKKI